jgi:hypothetical protein
MQLNTTRGYEPRFDLDLSFGEVAEHRLKEALASQIEVKRDTYCARTGQHFVEFECKGRPSGVSTTQAKWWALMTPCGSFVLCEVDRLRLLVDEARLAGRIKRCTRGSHPTAGALVYVHDMAGISQASS